MPRLRCNATRCRTERFTGNTHAGAPREVLHTYFFNVTNAAAVRSGAAPQLQQVGPYSFRQWRRKEVRTYLMCMCVCCATCGPLSLRQWRRKEVRTCFLRLCVRRASCGPLSLRQWRRKEVRTCPLNVEL